MRTTSVDALTDVAGQRSVPAGPLDALGADAERLRYLAAAGVDLAGSLNLRRSLVRSLHLLVPRLGSWALVGVAGPRELRCAVLSPSPASPSSPSMSGVFERTVDLPREGPYARVLATGRPETTTGQVAIGEEALAALAPDADLLDSARALRPAYATTLALPARGSPLGVLTVLREQGTRPLGDADAALLRELARRIALALDAARLYGERSHVARVLQASLLPPQLPEVPGVLLAARYRAGLEQADIGGDFYDVHGDAAAGDWSLVVGDVRGKGVEAAVLTGQARQSVRTAALVDRRPAAVLRLLNAALASDPPGGPLAETFVTVACGRLRPANDADDGVDLDVASAGHPSPLVLRADGRVDAVHVTGLLAGAFPDATYEQVRVRLAPGDSCLFFTDGVLEAPGADGQFGVERLAALLARCAGTEPEVLVEVVLEAVIEHVRDRGHDDIALLAVAVPR